MKGSLSASRKSAGSVRMGATMMSASGVNPLGATFGNSYSATVPMQFHGQDKTGKASLGTNPNQSVEDEYISNLQQQIHFMELELKILKEKVVEDEKKSGIGSLFDDEKSSF